MSVLEKAIQGARLLYAYTMYIEAPVEQVFKYTGDPAAWARDFDDNPIPRLALLWEGARYKDGSVMVLSPLRKDGTPTSVGSVRMELLYFNENTELSFRFLTGSHLIYRFFYEERGPKRTEFTVNVLLDAQSPPLNALRQRFYANKRRKASIQDHLKVKQDLEQRAARNARFA